MLVATEDFAAWLAQADIPDSRRTPQLDALLQAAFHFRQQQGGDYYSTRLLSHFLLHSNSGLKVAQIARLVGIARPTASKQQGMSSKAAIHQAHHRMDGRAHGKLLPRYAGPIASFLLGHPKASQAEQLDFVAQTFGVRVSRIALYKFLKKYGLHKLSAAAQTAATASPDSVLAATLGVESPPCAPAPTSTIGGHSPFPVPDKVESPSAPALASTTASSPARRPAPPIVGQPIMVPAPVIELARAIEPNKPFAPPFSSDGRTMPAPSC
jgi:hypothetical protein